LEVNVFKLNRKTEYALLSLRYLSGESKGRNVRSKEIAEHYQLPASLLAKVLQELKTVGWITSSQGSSGGYQLTSSLSDIAFADLLQCFSDRTGLVDCVESSGCCEQEALCDIQIPMRILDSAIVSLLARISVGELFAQNVKRPSDLSIFAARSPRDTR
jgi:Rrf2 family protein